MALITSQSAGRTPAPEGIAMDMVQVEIRPGYFVKVRSEDVDRYLAAHAGAKRADKAEEVPAEAQAAPAPMQAEEKAVTSFETENKAVSEPDAFRPRRSTR